MRNLFGRRPKVDEVQQYKNQLLLKLQNEYDKARSRQRSNNGSRPQKPSGYMRGIDEAMRIVNGKEESE